METYTDFNGIESRLKEMEMQCTISLLCISLPIHLGSNTKPIKVNGNNLSMGLGSASNTCSSHQSEQCRSMKISTGLKGRTYLQY